MGYANYINENLQLPFQDLLKRHPKQLERFEDYCRKYGTYFKSEIEPRAPSTFKMSLSVVEAKASSASSYGIQFQLKGWDNGSPIISFVYDMYPACCALKQLNYFSSVDHILEDDFFNKFVEMCIAAYNRQLSGTARIMINFVEYTRTGDIGTDETEIPRTDKEEIYYPIWYRWAKSYPTQETLFVNHNTGRIIHNVVMNYLG